MSKQKRKVSEKSQEKSGKEDMDAETEEMDDMDTLIRKVKELSAEKSIEKLDEAEEAAARLIVFGDDAIPEMLPITRDESNPAFELACFVLSGVGGPVATPTLVDILENTEHSEAVSDLISNNLGKEAVPLLIEKVKSRIGNPVKDKNGFKQVTNNHILCLGNIHCKESLNFLTSLLDDYIKEMPSKSFDIGKHKWKYSSFDLFFILEALVRQQNKKAIPHIAKARDNFPIKFVDHKICQIAIGKIALARPDGFLPMEVMDIIIPPNFLLRVLGEDEGNERDYFTSEYGDYFTKELYPHYDELEKKAHKKPDEDFDDDDDDEDFDDDDEDFDDDLDEF
ncbi:MAG: HEAT repeat domain-containing protein [Thermoplasmataceae archaeon]